MNLLKNVKKYIKDKTPTELRAEFEEITKSDKDVGITVGEFIKNHSDKIKPSNK